MKHILGITSTLLLLAPPALADEPASPQPETESTSKVHIGYQDVDAATVRVFSVGTVGVERVPGPDGQKQIAFAEPNAGHGTGFVVGSDGLLLTAQHVVDGARHVAVRFPGKGGYAAARVVVSEADSDIAVLKIDAKEHALPMFDEDLPLAVRQTVFALGYPLDATRKNPQSSRGIISGAIEDDMVQLDMTLNPGNSGGPLVDEQHRVVGMVVAGGNVDMGIQGIGYAVPLWKLKKAISEARARLDAGEVEALSIIDEANARHVDELLQRGVFRDFRKGKEEELSTSSLTKRWGQLVRTIGLDVDDADLLLFLAAKMWNVHMILEYADIETLAGEEVSAEQVRNLSGRLRGQLRLLLERAVERDDALRKRSEFAGFLLSEFGLLGTRESAASEGAANATTAQAEVSYELANRGAEFRIRPLLVAAVDNGTLPLSFGAGLTVAWAGKGDLTHSQAFRPLVGATLAFARGRDPDGSSVNSSAFRGFIETSLSFYGIELGTAKDSQVAEDTLVSFELAWNPGLVDRQVDQSDSSTGVAPFNEGSSFGLAGARMGVSAGSQRIRFSGDLRAMYIDDILYGWFGAGVTVAL